jgi:FkbM family methyltransferase
LRPAVNTEEQRYLQEEKRLQALPRYTPSTTIFLGKELQIVDGCTYLVGRDEIFGKGVYEFTAARPDPLILDCGANIGLSVIYFKHLYPQARITAFEPDQHIFSALQKNVAAFQLSGVELYNRAVWYSEDGLDFQIEGGFSGRVARPGDPGPVRVPSVRLRDFLNQPVDFLKMDIEGAEAEVIPDCAGLLGNVRYLFLEYHSHHSEQQTLHRLLSIIAEAGFRYHIKEAYTSPKPFQEHPNLAGMDLQLNVYCYRQESV